MGSGINAEYMGPSLRFVCASSPDTFCGQCAASVGMYRLSANALDLGKCCIETVMPPVAEAAPSPSGRAHGRVGADVFICAAWLGGQVRRLYRRSACSHAQFRDQIQAKAHPTYRW